MKKIKDFYEAYHFCYNHCMFNHCVVSNTMCIEVVKVSPKSNMIVKDKSKNTSTRVWLEWGPFCFYDGTLEGYHDIDLDCGGNTYEEAIIELANLIKKKYGDGNPDSKEGRLIDNAIMNIKRLVKNSNSKDWFQIGKRGWKKRITKLALN